MRGLERYLQPGEELLFHGKGFPWWASMATGPLVLLVPGVAIDLFEGKFGLSLEIWTNPVMWALVLFSMSFGLITGKSAVLVSDRRVIYRGAMDRAVLAIEHAAIADSWRDKAVLVLIGGKAGDVVRLAPGGSAATTEQSALALLLQWDGAAAGKRTEMERVVDLLALTPRRWRRPALPAPVRRLKALNVALILLSLPPWLVGAWWGLGMAVGSWHPGDIAQSWLAWGLTPVAVAALWLIQKARRYMTLWFASQAVPPETARLWLCATLRPDWRAEHPDTVIGRDDRLARIAAEERILSRLYARRISLADGPGPEDYSGGWVA